LAILQVKFLATRHQQNAAITENVKRKCANNLACALMPNYNIAIVQESSFTPYRLQATATSAKPPLPASGLADLNQCDLNHRFKSRFKSTDFFVKKSSDLNHTDDFTFQ